MGTSNKRYDTCLLKSKWQPSIALRRLYKFLTFKNVPTSSLETQSGSSDGAVSYSWQPAASGREGPW